MKVQVEEVSSVEKKLSFQIPGEVVSREVESAYRKLNQTVKLKGFRPGKVPRSILERYYGKQVADEVQTKLISDSYVRALEENKIVPVGEPNVLERQFDEAEEFKYTVTVETKPEVAPADYLGLPIERETGSVSDADVEARLAELQERNAQLKPVSPARPAREKDFVVFDFEGTLDGKPLEGWKAGDHVAEAGGKTLVGGLDAHLVGMTPGEEKTVSLTLPETVAQKDLAGKEIRVRLAVKEVKEKILPVLDDDFAKDTGEAQTLAELKAKLRRNLEEQQNARAEQAVRNRILGLLIEKTPFEVPKSMIDRQLEALYSRAEWRLANQGLRLNPENPESRKLRESLRPAAEKDVRSMLILEKIADQERISVGDEELDARLESLARELNERPEALRSLYRKEDRLEGLRAQLREEKTIAFLLSRAKVIDAPAPVTEPEKK